MFLRTLVYNIKSEKVVLMLQKPTKNKYYKLFTTLKISTIAFVSNSQ